MVDRKDAYYLNDGNGSNGNGGGLGGLPVWVRAVALVGVPAAIAIYLVLQITTFAMGPNGVQSLQSGLALHAREMNQHEASASVRAAELKALIESMVRVNQQICINTAQTSEDRTRCLR